MSHDVHQVRSFEHPGEGRRLRDVDLDGSLRTARLHDFMPSAQRADESPTDRSRCSNNEDLHSEPERLATIGDNANAVATMLGGMIGLIASPPVFI